MDRFGDPREENIPAGKAPQCTVRLTSGQKSHCLRAMCNLAVQVGCSSNTTISVGHFTDEFPQCEHRHRTEWSFHLIEGNVIEDTTG
jgi:hypothetical protein